MTDIKENSEMTCVEKIALRLDGMSYRDDLLESVTKTIKSAGLIVVVGSSDDIMEIYGAPDSFIDDEYSGLDPHIILASGKIIPEYEHDGKQVVVGRIEPEWCESGNPIGWSYKTDLPHATFRVMEDDDIYCIGMVIDYSSVRELHALL